MKADCTTKLLYNESILFKCTTIYFIYSSILQKKSLFKSGPQFWVKFSKTDFNW